MSGSVVIIDGHPDPDPARFCHALADSCENGAKASGHEGHIIRLAELEFPLLRSAADFEKGQLPESLEAARQVFTKADHLVFIYPLWLGDMPALMKAFLEQMFRPGIAIENREQGFPKQLLRGKRATILVTMGMPAVAYRVWFFSHTLKSFRRNVLQMCGVKPVKEVLIGGIGSLSTAKARYWLKYAETTGAGKVL